MNDELDIVNIVRQLRNQQFLIESLLKTYHITMVSSFKEYFVGESSDDEQTNTKIQITLENKAKSSPANASSAKNVK